MKIQVKSFSNTATETDVPSPVITGEIDTEYLRRGAYKKVMLPLVTFYSLHFCGYFERIRKLAGEAGMTREVTENSYLIVR